MQICPRSAVNMTSNDEGFLYPRINKELCNDCGACRNTCPVNQVTVAAADTGAADEDVCGKIPVGTGATFGTRTAGDMGKSENASNTDDKAASAGTDTGDVNAATEKSSLKAIPYKVRAYACFSNDAGIRNKSTSGGVFTQLSMEVLDKNGVVFGAGFDNDFVVRHSYVEKENDLDKLRRSKYVQSDTGNSFKEAKAFLKEGREVLFCGTPCQIAGLKAFLKNDYDSLLTCDLACHGVPSPLVWSMYLKFIKEKFGSGITAVSFRDKATGWKNSSMKICFKDGSTYADRVKKEVFFMGFGKSIFNRKSCYDCRFRINNTKADLTLADFWGIDRQNFAEYSDDKGVSLVLVHTAAGEKALSAIKNRIYIKEQNAEEAIKYNPRLVSSVGEPAARSSFFADIAAGYSFDRLRRKYMDNESIKYKLKCILKVILKRT